MEEIRKGACKYCGQIHMIRPLRENVSDAELDDMATKMCNCSGAKVEQHIEETVENAKDAINRMCDEDVQQILMPSILPIAGSKIKAVTVAMSGGVTIKISLGKDKIRVTKTITKQEVAE